MKIPPGVRALTLLVALLLTGAGVVLGLDVVRDSGRDLTATFSRTTSLYEGAKVKVLGVDVGKVTAIDVVGTSVRVRIRYDKDVLLPKDVHAVIVPPSVVGDRFVQLTPAYISGPTLKDDAELGLERTNVPVELGATFESLDELATALGPDGANRDGALSDLVTATADSLRGKGRDVNEAIIEFGSLMQTLAATSDDIGGTVDGLATISTRLAGNDAEVREIVQTLSGISTELNSNGKTTTRAITQLRSALGNLADFTAEHRAELAESVSRISEVTSTLAEHTGDLDYLLKVAPVGLTSLLNSAEPTNYDPRDLDASVPTGRTNSAGLRGAFFDDLDVTVAHAVAGFCGQLPDPAATSLAPLCSLLQASGADLGALLSEAIRSGLGAGAPSPTSLAELLGGPS